LLDPQRPVSDKRSKPCRFVSQVILRCNIMRR